MLVIVSNYLLVIADQSEVESATSQRDTAKALFQQTSDQKTAGLASAVDVLRSQVQLQSREQKLIVAQNDLAKQKLVLARAIGLPLGQKFEITTDVPYRELTPSSLDEAIQSAYKARADFQSQMNQVRSAELARKAASAERYPSLGVETDYGLSGVNPGSSHGTVDAAATLRIPIFQGGRVHGDVLRADASLTRERQRLEDLRAKIDQEVRDAYLDLEAAAQEVSVEKSAVTLATQTLEQSRDRFVSGVTDNIEVVQAQDALAIATDSYIASLYSHNLAKISLARAIGVAESGFARIRGGKMSMAEAKSSNESTASNATGPNVPADNAGAADPPISAYPSKALLQALDISCLVRCSGRCRRFPLALSFRLRIHRRCAGGRPSLPCQRSHFRIYPEGQRWRQPMGRSRFHARGNRSKRL